MPDGWHTVTGGNAPDTTKNISAAIRRANGNPGILIINYPGNAYDAMNIDTILKCYRVLVDTSLAHDLIPVVMSPQPREQFSVANQQKMMVIRDSLENIFPDYFVDFYTGLAQPGSYVALSEYSAGDGVHRNDGGHRRYFELLKAHNPFRWYSTSSTVIANPDVAESYITNHTQGVHKYQISTWDNYGLAADTVVTVTVNPSVGCAGQRRVVVPSGAGTLYLTETNFTYNPGDTVVISNAYFWKQFTMKNIHGTPTCPVIVINSGGPISMEDGMGFDSCSYIRILGSGSPIDFYGFNFHGSVPYQGTALSVSGKSKNIEISNVSIRNKRYGFWCKNEASCEPTLNDWTMDSIWFHDSKIRDVAEQGLYWGSTSPSGLRSVVCDGDTLYPKPSRLDNLRIFNLDIDSTGRAAIQVSAGKDRTNPGISHIYNNIIRNTGRNLDNTQGGAISLGGFTNAYVYGNDIKYSFIYGIWAVGASYIRVEDNRVDSAGWHKGGSSELISYARPIMIQSTANLDPIDSVQYIIKNNQVGVGGSGTSYRINIVGSNLRKGLGLNTVCGNTNLNGTAALIEIDGGEVYSTNCGIGANLPPSASAGANKTIRLPVSSLTLTGSGVDSDGSISSYSWTKISGPSSGTIVSPSSASTNITGLEAGTYFFQITVTDDDGATASALVRVEVQAAIKRVLGTHLILKPLKEF
jgi:hypothetical protein